MKIALIHEWLVNWGGSEAVLKSIYELYPSPIYTLVKDNNFIANSPFKEAEIYTSFIQNLPFSIKKYRNYLPLFPLAIEQFDLSDYDLIISSSHAVAKGVLRKGNQIHISYCHTPIRYAWDMYHQYLEKSKFNRGLKGFITKIFLHYIRNWDVLSSNRVDYFIANSNYVAKRIKNIYRRDAEVIYPPVNISSFKLEMNKDNYYLAVSRLVPYKRMDLIVEAFSKMLDKKLIVIGNGPDLKRIKKIASRNVELLGYQPNNILHGYLKKAKAFVFAAEEDFGILPVEAQACGTPVIAYGKGGVLETVKDKKSGIFFKRQDMDSIIEAVKTFERIEDKFDPLYIRKNSEKFDVKVFKEKFKYFIDNKISIFIK